MLSIPAKLMISPITAFNDPVLGHVFKNNRDILKGHSIINFGVIPSKGDLLLTMYLSYELSKGKDSFFYPYLNILPVPGSISTWSSKELEELQVRR
jgi:hypothetical protein